MNSYFNNEIDLERFSEELVFWNSRKLKILKLCKNSIPGQIFLQIHQSFIIYKVEQSLGNILPNVTQIQGQKPTMLILL